MRSLNIPVRWAIIGAYLFVVLAFAVASYAGINRIADTDNNTRCAVVGLVNQLSANAERTARALIASPTATPDQKQTARHTLDALIEYRNRTVIALHHPHGKACS